MGNESGVGSAGPEPQSAGSVSSVGQTASVGRSTSAGSAGGGAAKVFREFKWGLLTLFLLMVVVIGLVYDGGRKKKTSELGDPGKTASAAPDVNLDQPDSSGPPPGSGSPGDQDTGATPPPPAQSPPANTTRNGPLLPETQEAPVTQLPLANPGTGLGVNKPAPTLGENPGVKTASKKDKSDKNAPKKSVADEAAPPNPAAAPAKTYVVQSGDTLTKIANRELPGKGGIKAILEANKDILSDANKLRAGMTLKIPAKFIGPGESAETVKKKGSNEEAPGQKPSILVAKNNGDKQDKSAGDDYVVQSGDTLERIARKLFNDGRKWRELYEWNREQIADPGRLRVGQTLKVKEAAAARPASTKARAEAEPKVPAETITATMATQATQTAQQPEPQPEETPSSEVQTCSSSASLP